MATSGSAIGGNDVFNGKSKITWWLMSQDPLAGAHGRSTVKWAWNINWASGDNCHRIEDGQVTGNSVSRYSNSLPHVFNSGHVHTGDWPTVSQASGGGFASGTYTIDHDVNGNANIVLSASHHGTGGSTSTASNTWALTQIPQTVTAPSAASVARVSDTQQTVSWTNNSTGTAPYANIKVYRSTDGGAYALVATLGAAVTSYSDTGTSANHKYTYQISAVGTNTVEVGYATTSAIWTTPGAPTTLTATKLAGGNIRLNWANNVNFSEYTVRIEESQNGGAYAEVTNVATGTVTWDHVGPSTLVTHKYRIRARTSSGTTLNSSYSNESDTITLLATANAPTGLAPAGIAKDAAEDIVFTWTHNPADGTPQSKYQLQWSTNGGAAWTTVGPTTSTVSSYTLPASSTTNGQTITWRVQTAGENGTLGAYSSNATFTTSARPTSTISSPSGGTYSLSALTVNWTYFQAQGSAQTAWHAFLWKKGALSDYSDATLIEEQVGSGTTASVLFASTLLDGATYGVRVYVTSAAGLTSIDAATEREEFTVTYLPPADVTIVAIYDRDYGRMVLGLTGDIAVGGVTVDIDTVDLQRQINGGAWVTWATGIVLTGAGLTASVVDTMPTIRGTNNYRAVIRSAVPSSAMSDEVAVVTAEHQWGFLTTGPSFSQLVRARARLGTRSSVSREKETYHFAGREDPVELSGEALSRSLVVSGVLYPPSNGGQSSEPFELEELGETDDIVLWRDYTGRRVFASIGNVEIDYNTDSVLYPFSFPLTRVGYDENIG